MIKKYIIPVFAILAFISCKDDDAEPEPTGPNVPAFYNDGSSNAPSFTKLLGFSDRVNQPQDLDFHPSRENELWIINKGTDNTGGSTVTVSNAGLANQSSEYRRDGNAWHFMALPSAISFSKDNDNFGTTANIQDANRSGGTFTGPSLWSSNMDVYAQDPGHFAADHGPGHDDHSDGVIYRYVELEVEREPDVPAHMVKDEETGILFICDPASSQVLWMNTLTGSIDRSIPLVNEPLASHQQMKDLEWGVFTTTNLDKPCGIELIGNILYVSDNGTGEIIAYDKELKTELARIDTGDDGIMGIKADKNGQLWYVNASNNGVYRIDQN